MTFLYKEDTTAEPDCFLSWKYHFHLEDPQPYKKTPNQDGNIWAQCHLKILQKVFGLQKLPTAGQYLFLKWMYWVDLLGRQWV